MKIDLNMFRKNYYLELLITKANATAITTINRKFVQKALLQLLPKINSKAFPPTPVAQKTAIITAIPITTIKKVLNPLLISSPFSPEETKPHNNKTTKTITKETVKNKIIFPTTILGKTAPTKINPITNAINAFNCLFSSPKTFVFSSTAKTMKNINKKGYTNCVKISLCKIVSVAIFFLY